MPVRNHLGYRTRVKRLAHVIASPSLLISRDSVGCYIEATEVGHGLPLTARMSAVT